MQKKTSVMWRNSRLVHLGAVMGVALLWSAASASAGDEPVYLEGTWLARGPRVNLVTTAEGHRVAVDNDGRFIIDPTYMPSNRNIRFAFDSLAEHAGEYYLAQNKGNFGYAWVQATQGGRFVASEQLPAMTNPPLFSTFGFNFDPDPVRGDSGLAIFPAGRVAVVCARSQWDSRAFTLARILGKGEDAKSAEKDDLDIPIRTPEGLGVRSADFPDRVVLDADGKGFWYIGSQASSSGRTLAAVHARPGLGTDGLRTLNLSKTIALGDTEQVQFETAAEHGGKLYLLLAQKNPSIGGVNAKRQLLKLDAGGGKVVETHVAFERYIADVRMAASAKHIALHSFGQLIIVDSATMQPAAQRAAAELTPGDGGDYHIKRMAASADGRHFAVGLATAYQKPHEPTHVVLVDPQGATTKRWTLKPGAVSDLKFTPDGGVLLFSDDYTAKLGGGATIQANEAAAIARARQALRRDEAQGPIAVVEPKLLDKALADRHTMWFAEPARSFGGSCLPIGNGHLGVKLIGGTDEARAVFNVDSMWQGNQSNMGQYQAFGELAFVLKHDPKKVTDYRRELDLRTGLHTTTYTHEGVRYKREAFCSYPHGLLAIRFSADRPGKLTGSVELMAMHKATLGKSRSGIEFSGELSNKRKFKAVLKLKTEGGRVLPEAGEDGVRQTKWRRYSTTQPFNSVKVEGCDSVTLYLAADTDYAFAPDNDFRGASPTEKINTRLAHIERHSFDAMQQASAADVAALFDRCTLDLATTNPEAEALPIDKRLRAYRDGEQDPGLEALAFDAVRHMMIACSRPGSLPANLQGIWNDSNWPAWTCDYHADINIQMNYWFVEPANLAECAVPLFDYIESQIPNRRRVARQIYGDQVRGWSVHYMNGIFGAGGWKNFPAGSAWYAWHFAEHFKFSQDRAYLEAHAYPVLKELSEHWQDLLIERPNGELTTPKTMSPEHKPEQFGISQDLQIVHNLFTDFTAASRRLGRDAAFRDQVLDLRRRLVPIQIGRWGQLQEWEVDRDSRDCTHRHIQHLFAAFPGSQITDQTPELAEAAVTSLEARGGGRTGWSRAWRMSIFARLGRPNLFYRQLRGSLRSFHPHLIWEGKSQIDAPCGYASGICEALLQSHKAIGEENDSRYLVELLPALPAQWPTGKVKGLRARGGFEVDIEWADGQLTLARIRNVSSPTDNCTVRYGSRTSDLTIPRGKQVIFK